MYNDEPHMIDHIQEEELNLIFNNAGLHLNYKIKIIL